MSTYIDTLRIAEQDGPVVSPDFLLKVFGPPKLTVIVNNDLETKHLQEDASRLQREVSYLTQTIRLQRQDLNAQINQRDLKAAALETALRALARRLS